MKRRSFIKKSTLASAGAITMPYILPSGLLSTSTAPPLSEYVVFVLFAGGIRQQESVLQRYLAEGQNEDIEGNIMYNMLTGAPPEDKIAYGKDDTANSIIGGIPIDPILQTPLDQIGTLFPEVRFSNGGTGHFSGLSTGVSGNYSTTQGLKSRPAAPTIFEYLRRHAGFKATDCWFVSVGITGSRPLLNFSANEDYGRMYGGNFISPITTFGVPGMEHFMDFKNYHPETEWGKILEMRNFLNQNFRNEGFEISHLYNDDEEEDSIKEFIRKTFEKVNSDSISLPPVNDNGDLKNIGFAVEILNWFKPKLTVLDMTNCDICHGNYTGYLKNLHRADHGIGFLWREIQQIPEMAGKTTMIVMPEHGRDLEPNPIMDDNDWFAYDHSSNNENTRRIFSLMAGPGIDAGLRIGDPNNPIGDASDIVPTIADLFGIKDTVMNQGLLDSNSRSLFDRI